MKALLVQPPYPFSEFPKPSWALMSLGAVLQQQGVEVEVLDLLSTRCSPRKIEERLSRFQPDLIGATCVTMNFPSAVKILQHCKAFAPRATIIMGGPHVTFTAAETLRDFPEVDIVVRGEGEETLKELVRVLDAGRSLQEVKGLSFRRNGTILQTEDRLEVDFAWKLLSGDLLEEQGKIPHPGQLASEQREDPLRVLARRISPATSFPLQFVASKLRKLAERGIIICDETPKFHHWQWKES
ncbi:MAG: cobalamin-dependent protein [Proteobacteria bacterium]|nr:cobalamin-dependent protein [Pseudomonadota bacterium]